MSAGKPHVPRTTSLLTPPTAAAASPPASTELLAEMKSDACILNFARGELVDSAALKALFDGGHTGKYVTDFPEDLLWDAMVESHRSARLF